MEKQKSKKSPNRHVEVFKGSVEAKEARGRKPKSYPPEE